MLKVCKGRSKRIGACCDTGHWPRSGLNPIECLKKLEGRIISFHFKDLNKLSPAGHDVPWGTGACNVKGMLAEVQRQGVKAVFSIEYEYHWGHSLPEIAQCVKYFDKTAVECQPKLSSAGPARRHHRLEAIFRTPLSRFSGRGGGGEGGRHCRVLFRAGTRQWNAQCRRPLAGGFF